MTAASVIPPSTLSIRTDTQIDWACTSSARSTFARRYANAFLQNHWRSDMSFKMAHDGQIIPAHSIIVACGSPVLERCCFAYGSGDLVEAAEVTVPEFASVELFLIVLRYLYNGHTAGELTEENVATVLKLADYFELCQLLDECIAYIESKLSKDNVCAIFNTLHDVDIEIRRKCLHFMQVNINEILLNGTVMDMDDAVLAQLLEQDELNISSEMQLVQPMISWADAECKARSLEVNAANRRIVLESRVALIRFGTMELSEFFQCVKSFGKGFFSNDEVSLTGQDIFERQRSPAIVTNPTSGFGIPNGSMFGSIPVATVAPPPPSTSLPSTVVDDPVPFSSVARIRVLTPVKFATQYDTMFESICSNDFILDVSRLPKPFTLLELQLHNVSYKMKVFNVLTNENVVHQKICPASTTIMFRDGVVPNKNGRIHLRLSSAEKFNTFVIKKGVFPVSDGTRPVCEHTLTCVQSMTYKHPPIGAMTYFGHASTFVSNTNMI